MKGINAKRIAALAAGAVLLGSSVVAANVMYQNTELVNDNGQPTVKIVVGSNAQISDGVAAANIAAAIANQAYKSSTLSASLSGQPTCSAGATSGTGAGTCEVTDKKVTLEIEVPGVMGNAYQFKTLITDTIDKTLANRIDTRSEDNYTSDKLVSDVSTILSPLRGVYDSAISRNLYRISGSEFSGFATRTVTDPQAGGEFVYQGEQSFWVGSSHYGVVYDSGSAYRQVVAKPRVAVYNLRFTGNDYGIPYCTKTDETNTDGNWAWCASDTSSQYRTDNHRVKIPFMGSEWVISSMVAPSSVANNSNAVYNGGTVKLAKEAKYDIINVGGELDAGTMKVRLADISVATGTENKHPAIIDVLDSSDAVIGQIQVNPGDTYTFTQSGTSNQIKVHVYRTAPGFTLNAKWAEMAIYTDEITLQDGQRYNLASSGDDNYNYKVSLLWKNKDYTGSSGGNSTQADSLREIVLYDEDTFIGKKYVAGDSYVFPKKNSAFRLTYNGLDLTDGDYQAVSVTSVSSTDYPVSNSTTQDCKGAVAKLTYTAKLFQFKTDGNKFGGSGDLLNNYMVDNFYYDPIGGSSWNATNTTSFSGTQNTSMARADWKGFILYRPSGYDCYLPVAANSGMVKFDTAGSDSSAQGAFTFSDATSTIGPSGTKNGTITYQEDAGKNDTTSHQLVYMQFPFIYDTDFKFKSSDSSTSNVYYAGLFNDMTYSAYEPTFITERGSKVLSVGTTDYSMHTAKKIGQPSFTFAAASTEVGSMGSEMTLKVGESTTLTNGVKITVKKIDETVGSCVASTTGGAASCTASSAGMSAKIMPNNAPSVEVTEPYKLSSPLVTTDKDAGYASVVITVGGPMVNSVTDETLKDSPVDFKTNSVVVKEVGSKIVVAGNTAADTMKAAEEFIAGISRK